MNDGLNDTYICMSSAYVWYPTPCFLKIRLIGAVYMVKRIGPRTEPCATPHQRETHWDDEPSIWTRYVLPSRYDRNHDSALPHIPYSCWNRDINCSWSTQSNAADKSSMTSITTQLTSKADAMSCCTWVVWSQCYALLCMQTEVDLPIHCCWDGMLVSVPPLSQSVC